MNEVELHVAKRTLSALMKAALVGRPMIITRDGEKAAVVMSFDDYQKFAKPPDLRSSSKP